MGMLPPPRVGTGFSAPIALAGLPDGTGRVLVVERAGRIRILTPGSGAIAATPFLDIVGQTTTDGERGLLGLALAPDFNATGTFYVFLTNTAGNIEIRRYRTLAGNRDQADPASGDIILVIPHNAASNHNGGWIEFGPDGLLYLGVGDGGSGLGANARNLNLLLGKILRINPAADAFPGDPNRDYAIPASNPFASAGGAPEIWAYGLRNPFRAGFDAVTGNLWIGDVGEGTREEVDLMRPADGGADFGWNIVEGTVGAPQPGFTPPVAEYSHGNGPRPALRRPVESRRQSRTAAASAAEPSSRRFAAAVRVAIGSSPAAPIRSRCARRAGQAGCSDIPSTIWSAASSSRSTTSLPTIFSAARYSASL